MHVAEAESMATVYPAAHNLCSRRSPTHEFEKRIAQPARNCSLSRFVHTHEDTKREEQAYGLYEDERTRKKKGGDE